jgi:dienelactone hydrolase
MMNLALKCCQSVTYVSVSALAAVGGVAQESPQLPGDVALTRYFESQTAKLEAQCLADIKTAEDWNAKREGYREQLLEMLSLDPMPPRTSLEAKVTGKSVKAGSGFSVENVVFQSLPGLYVTGNLYIPDDASKPCPTVLYVCGHGAVKEDGISYGNKVHYQHHGGWFARHGYVCLTIDSLQLGEIEGIHHGTYRYGRWWWNARGYSPAGVEAWNCLRALDYLETRSEVDKERFGVTGRSGGGAYSWWISAIDDRIKVAVPVAGITSLRNHVVDGCVEGHCDCMYHVNTYRWDFPQIAALVAPRPLLISNTDKDGIFPLDGVYAVHQKVRKIYDLLGAGDKLGLHITEGPHKDTQDLRIHAFTWFERFLKGTDPPPLIDNPAIKFFEKESLKVLKQVPADQRNTTIDNTFTKGTPRKILPKNSIHWAEHLDRWMRKLKNDVFRGWPEEAGDLSRKQVARAEFNGVKFEAYEFESQDEVTLPLFMLVPPKATNVGINVLDAESWPVFVSRMNAEFAPQLESFVHESTAFEEDSEGFAKELETLKKEQTIEVYFPPRGIGPTAWSGDSKRTIQVRRRFMLLGQTLDGMRVWDIRRAIQATRARLVGGSNAQPEAQPEVWLRAKESMACNALYASLFEKGVHLTLTKPSRSHRDGPDYLNVLKHLDVPTALAMASSRSVVAVTESDTALTGYAEVVGRAIAAGDADLDGQ